MKPLNIRKVLVIYKEEIGSPPRPHRPFQQARLKRLSFQKLTEPQRCLTRVLEVLKNHGIPHHVTPRGGLKNVKGYDLLITVGGDGTFLDTSHYALPHQMLLGVNSHPLKSHGAFCATDRRGFEKIFQDLLRGKAPLLPLNRLQVCINGRPLPVLALNDALFANVSPAGTSRHVLKVGGKSEEQKSSGIWISTAAGSTAAIRSAGGKPMRKKSKDLQFWVREPFVKNGEPYRLIRGKIPPGKTLKIVSKMSKAAVFLDGAHLHYPVRYGDEVEMGGTEKTLLAVLRK
ncbi:MAG: hypothetical protein U1F57_02505 [bacterium]